MPRISDIEILHGMEQPVISVRVSTKVEELPMVIGESYGKMAAYLKKIGELPADTPYVAYRNADMQNLDVEIGFPVCRPLPGEGSIRPSAIPEGKRIFCMYLGAYGEMSATYEEMFKWISDNGYKPEGTSYEYYYNGPDYPEEEMLTMLVMPLE